MKTWALILGLLAVALCQGCTFALGPDHTIAFPLSQEKGADADALAVASP